MSSSDSKLIRLARDAQSGDQQTRGQAVQDLLLWCQQDASVRQAALPVFQARVNDWRDAWSARCSVKGIELIEGPAIANELRLKLLNDSREQVAVAAALELSDPEMAPAVIEVMKKFAEPRVRITFIAVLGRLRNPIALPVLAGELKDPQFRPHAVEAIKELGDPRAIALLEPYKDDRSPAWPVDNHGPMLHVSDLVAEALARLGKPPPRAAMNPTISATAQPTIPTAPPIPRIPTHQGGADPGSSAGGGPSRAGLVLAPICIAVGALSILANLYTLSLAKGAYEFSTTPSIATIPVTNPSPLDDALADRIAKAANQTAGYRFTPAQVAVIKSRLSSDGTLAHRHDESAVVAAFINSGGNAVVTFDSAQTIAMDPSGAIVGSLSPTTPGGGVHVSVALILLVVALALASMGLAALLILAAMHLIRGSPLANSLLSMYCRLKIPVAIVAGVAVAALNYQTDTGRLLGVAGVMTRCVIQAILLIAVGTTFPLGLMVYLTANAAGRTALARKRTAGAQ